MSRPRYSLLAEASVAGLLFPLSIVAGYFLGKWIADRFGLGEWPSFVGAALGVAAGFWNLFRLARRMGGA